MSERRKQSGFGFWFVIFVTLTVAYILSAGPVLSVAVYLSNSGPSWWEEGMWSVVQVFYYPLEIILPDSGPVNDLFERYIELWLDNGTNP